jgi:hypothetical protein
MAKTSKNDGFLVTPEHKGSVRKCYPVYQKNFAEPTPNEAGPYLIIGFDTEYQSTDRIENDKIMQDNEVLSYQYSCSVINSENEGVELEWKGIVLPDGDRVEDRLYLHEFVEFAIGHGVKLFPDIKIPKTIYLAAHFTRADIPGFKDFKEDQESRKNLNFENIRNSFVNVRSDIKAYFKDNETNKKIEVSVKVRDTMHLAPQGANSLAKLGDILDFKKLKLAETLKEEKKIKRQMKAFLKRDWEFFKEYAIRDAEVCTKYIKQIIRLYYKETGKFQLPLTLTSIGVALLIKYWSEKSPELDVLDIIGKEKYTRKYYDKKYQRTKYYTKEVFQKKLYWHIDFITESYHGGRNEQFWFGPCHKDIWYDYDLSSAYPSAMALIGRPNWNKIEMLTEGDEERLLNFKPVDLVFANVNFKFHKNVRFPVLPVRTDTGLLFPRSGNSITHISEILLAKKLGCDIELVEARYIPSERTGEKSNRIFRGFLQECIANREQYEKKTVKNLFWKEIANSTYGKTAQGLRERRVYDLKSDEVKRLEPSKITNPVYASFITAFCRGTLSEIMNNLPKSCNIFSVTTDGFLTNATEEMMEKAVTKKVKNHKSLCSYYRSARGSLVGNEVIHETKHIIKQPLGWRTRGQATIKASRNSDWPEKPKSEKKPEPPKPDEKTVLAKAGIKLPNTFNKLEENDEIVELFFNREPHHKIPNSLGLGIKDMYRSGYDFVFTELDKRLSMEFDWKRKPYYVGETRVKYKDTINKSHVYFSTTPWDSVEDYYQVRQCWEDYNKTDRHCLKTKQNFEDFSQYVESKLSLDPEAARYLKKENGDIIRLRRELITAWRNQKSGTHELQHGMLGNKNIFKNKKLKAQDFANLLNDVCGIPCEKSDVDNGIKVKIFKKHQTPNTDEVQSKLMKVKSLVFPKLIISDFKAKKSKLNIESVKRVDCYLSQKMPRVRSRNPL